ncbi:MAG: hypothetical protein M3128_05065 [Verrucomicrobiota bacterium]|nr:hypothetical protein [Verrucomicrobiota bacterium]
MDRAYHRYDEAYSRPRRKANLFVWTIAILLLIGLAMGAWLGSYYIFSQPERPDSYRILKKLHKIEQPKRFQLTAAPPGEFLSPKQLFERYAPMHSAELARTNAELARNFIRNYQQVAGLVPYVVGRFTLVGARELGSDDLFASGMVTLTDAVDFGEVLMEHVYPADPQTVPLMKQTLLRGLEIKLERTHDLSVVVHAEKLNDGRVLITTVPLLYGSYTVTQGRGSFSLEPPLDLNMAAGWPLFKDDERKTAEASRGQVVTAARSKSEIPGITIPGIGPGATPAVAANELIRVEQAAPVETPTPTPAPRIAEKLALSAKGRKLAKGEKASPTPAAVANKPAVTSTPVAIAAASTAPRANVPAISSSPVVAVAPPSAPAIPPANPDSTLASTAGGGSWKTYPPGKMPVGRLINPADLGDVADHGLAGERVYLRGQFVVNFAEANRAVLRPKNKLSDTVLHFGAPSLTRIVVEFPAGYTPPAQGSVVTRDEARPYEITEVRKQSDGQLNVFVREIMQ